MLTDTQIRKSKTPAKPVKLADGRGLYLLLTTSGGRLWRYKYRFADKEKLLAIGAYPDVSLSDAREACADARRKVAKGVDPSEQKKRDKRDRILAANNSFELVAREWFENVKGKWVAVTHADAVRRFDKYVFPQIGHRPIAEVTAPELLDVLRKVEATGTIVTAHKLANHAGQIFAFGIGTGRCHRNPARDLKGVLKPRPKAKAMAAVSLEDLPDLLIKIDAYDGEEQTKLALQLLALTLVRTTELRGATWPEIDMESATWNIPADRMKAGLPHFVPLSRQALAVLQRLKEINGNRALVFPGRKPMKPMSKNTMLFAVYRLGYHSRMSDTVYGSGSSNKDHSNEGR